MLAISKYSMGIGDRFGLEGAAQLRPFLVARQQGVDITPVWNKSNREHTLVGTCPDDVRAEADAAVASCNWQGAYLVDADHIGLATVDRFIAACDFFTIDVADSIGKAASGDAIAAFVRDMRGHIGAQAIPGLPEPIVITAQTLADFAEQYLAAAQEAGRIHRAIAERKGAGNFITEVSFDEATTSQSPGELLLILSALAREQVPVTTVAPKFTGDFLKGIDYVGDVDRFAREFAADLAVLAHAQRTLRLPAGLKLSVHSGSDKLSLYPRMHEALVRAGAGLHLKTAGTTWLEEVAGLAQAGGEGLAFAKALYREALARYDELAKPYATVIAIEHAALPSPDAVERWSGQDYAHVLDNDPRCRSFSIHFRQLVHISFRIAAEKRAQYLDLLRAHRQSIEARVSHNLLHRHIEPLFLGRAAEARP